jgi:hypothetical protein
LFRRTKDEIWGIHPALTSIGEPETTSGFNC